MKQKQNNVNKTESASKPYKIPVEGSLSLLALGAVGLKAWRKVRDEADKKNQDEVKK